MTYYWILVLALCIGFIIFEYTRKPKEIHLKQKTHKFLDAEDGEWKTEFKNDNVESEELIFINPTLETITTKRITVDNMFIKDNLISIQLLADHVDFVSSESSTVFAIESKGDLRASVLKQDKGINQSQFAFADKVTSQTCATNKPVIVPTVDIFKNATPIRMGKQTSEIPKIIHMNWGLWDKGELPQYAQELLQSWKREFPSHEFIIWDQKKSEDFIRNEFPIWFPLWQSCTRKVMLSDLLRTLVVYRYGGMYRDIDLKSNGCKEVWSKKGIVLFTENIVSEKIAEQVGEDQQIRSGLPEELIRVANYAFASAPYQSFLYFILHEMRMRWDLQKQFTGDYDILYITGPALWSTIYDRHKSCAHLLSLEKSNNMIEHLAFGGWRKDNDVK